MRDQTLFHEWIDTYDIVDTVPCAELQDALQDAIARSETLPAGPARRLVREYATALERALHARLEDVPAC